MILPADATSVGKCRRWRHCHHDRALELPAYCSTRVPSEVARQALSIVLKSYAQCSKIQRCFILYETVTTVLQHLPDSITAWMLM